MIQIVREERASGKVLKQNCMGGVEYLTFPALEASGLVEHLFSTRLGGCSKGIFSSMNLSFERGDDQGDVLSNYERIAKILHCSAEDMVSSKQTHMVNIRLVTQADRGKGIVRPLDYTDVDGLITKERGIALVTTYADCVPLYFLDPVHEVIGLAHSGWRGTVMEMGRHMAEAMSENFNTRPEELIAAIGPAICSDCYQVGDDVAGQFKEMEAGFSDFLEEIWEKGTLTGRGGSLPRVLRPGGVCGKYQLNLWLANLLILRKAGIPLERISVADVCTCHNPSYLFSHRASGGRRGNLGAFLMLKKKPEE